MSLGWFDYTEPFRTTSSQWDQGMYGTYTLVLSWVVQPQRTSSNLLKPLQCRESNVCRGLSHEFGVVRLYRTFTNHISTWGSSMCVGYLYTSSRWLNCSELPRTFSNHFSAEKAMYVQVFYMSLGWFNYTKPSRTTSSQGDQGV